MRDDGRWELDRDHNAVRPAREAVVERITVARRWAGMRPDPAALEANRRRIERERAAHADQLARMQRILIHAFPRERPEALVLIDVEGHEITTFMGDEIARAIDRLAGYEIIGAVDVRALLRTLKVDPGERRLAELSPPQKTRQRLHGGVRLRWASSTRCCRQGRLVRRLGSRRGPNLRQGLRPTTR